MGALCWTGCAGSSAANAGAEAPAPVAESGQAEPAQAEPAAPSMAEVGHADLRVQFAIPEGTRLLQGVAMTSEDMAVFGNQGAGGVGAFEDGEAALSSVVVFSDPAGLGVDFGALEAEKQAVLAGRYSAVLREAIASATEGVVEPLGDRLAIRVDLPVVELPNRPTRTGRHFLVFVGTGTVSVDCIWEPEKAALVEAACATIATNFVAR